MNFEHSSDQENLQPQNSFAGGQQENLSGKWEGDFERGTRLPDFTDDGPGSGRDKIEGEGLSELDRGLPEFDDPENNAANARDGEKNDLSELDHGLPEFDDSENVADKSSHESEGKNRDSADNGRVEKTSKDGDEKVSYEIHTRNESLEGDRHPITGVPFEKKTVEDADGNEVTGVFPEFDSKFDAQLPEEKLQSSDCEQFSECNAQLKEAVESDAKLAEQFTPTQLEQISNGDTPDGYTWHHHEEKGKMQLVDTQTHLQTGHTGGRSIWGGGTESR